MNVTNPFNHDPLDSSISEVFFQVAARFPSRIALVCNGRETSYRELAEKAGHIAALLCQKGVEQGNLVGLFARRTPETIAAILGILETGAAYVPFDPSYPPNLLKYIFQDSAPSLMLVQRSLCEADDELRFWEGEALDIDAVFDAPNIGGEVRAKRQIASDDLAYVMYTSGSTGRPKGVMVPHRGVLRLILDNTYAHFGPDEVLLQLAPLSFDASTFEIWGALLHGGCLAILPTPHPSLDEIAEAIDRHKVTTMLLTTGLFHLMVDHRLNGLKPLRQLLAGGDVLSREHVDKALRNLPDCRLINAYGPTENTTITCCYDIPRGGLSNGPVPIGVPIARTKVCILDEMLGQVADGEEGELYVGGAGLARGYLNRPDLTAERFIPNPFDESSATRLYRTGDRGRKLPDGNFEFLGRVDRQIKIGGKRVELDEIESCLRRSELVGDAAVTCGSGADGLRRIEAFVTPPAASTVSEEALRAFLRRELPDYMIPSAISVLDKLPLTPAGKVDRTRLAVKTSAEVPAQNQPLPGNPVEAELLRIWRQVLGRQAVGPEDNFFDLGGSSLQLMKVHALLQDSMKCNVTVADLFNHPKISAMAAHILRVKEGMPVAATWNVQDRVRRLLPPLAQLTSISRPLSVLEYYHACIGSCRYTLEVPREVVFVLRGEGALSIQQWQQALDRVVEVNPGTRLRMVGKCLGARWQSDGLPPRLRALERCDWDVQSDRGSEFIQATRLPLDSGPTIELIVAPQPDKGSLLILRALHAVMDGGGGIHFLHELFRALRGERLLGSNAGYSDIDLMRSIGKVRSPDWFDKTARPTGNPEGGEIGDEFRRISLGPPRKNLLAKVAVAMAEFAHQYSDLPVLIAVPVDLRMLEPALLATTNFSNVLFVHLEKGEGIENFTSKLQTMLAQSLEEGYQGASDIFKLLPLPWLDLLVSRSRINYRRRKPLETAVISNLGCQDSASLSCPGFHLSDMVALPQPGSAFATLAGVDNRVDLILNLSKVLASNGRFDALMAHLQRRLKD